MPPRIGAGSILNAFIRGVLQGVLAAPVETGPRSYYRELVCDHSLKLAETLRCPSRYLCSSSLRRYPIHVGAMSTPAILVGCGHSVAMKTLFGGNLNSHYTRTQKYSFSVLHLLKPTSQVSETLQTFYIIRVEDLCSSTPFLQRIEMPCTIPTYPFILA